MTHRHMFASHRYPERAYDRALLSAAGLSNARSGTGTIFPQDFGRDSPL